MRLYNLIEPHALKRQAITHPSLIYRIPETNRLIGKARFVDEHTIMVNENFQVRFKSAVISTGSAPVIPFELSRYGADSGVYTTNDFFDMVICQFHCGTLA